MKEPDDQDFREAVEEMCRTMHDPFPTKMDMAILDGLANRAKEFLDKSLSAEEIENLIEKMGNNIPGEMNTHNVVALMLVFAKGTVLATIKYTEIQRARQN